MTLERGTLLNKRYRIAEILGQGGMAAIYRALDENLSVEVAVKENLFTTEEYARQFRREAVILASLRHPNLPRVTDHFVIHEQGQYLVMDYIEGEDLRQRMDRLETLPESEVIVLGVAISQALSYLHTREPAVLHRDIKPGNVKITSTGQVFLVDFGLAKVVLVGQETTDGARAMTPGYSPPEQYGTARTDPRSDIYSLGATLYSALTNALPEDGLARAMGQLELTPVRKRNPHITRRLGMVIEKALEVQPEDRFQTTEDFKQALLNARTTSRRRQPIELVVPPPPYYEEQDYELLAGGPAHPVGEAGLYPVGSSLSDNPPGQRPAVLEAPAALEEGAVGLSRRRISAPLPVSTPFAQPAPVKHRRKRSRLRIAFLMAALLLVTGAILFVINPGIFDQGRALILSSFFPSLPAQMDLRVTSPSLQDQSGSSQAETPQPLSIVQAPTSTSSPPAPTPSPTVSNAIPVTIQGSPEPTFTPSPTASGGGSGQLAFASERVGKPQIFLVNMDGTGVNQITNIPDGACQPDWSPDGMRLVFISPCRKSQEVYEGTSMFVIDADGSNLHQLPMAPGGDYDPAWSPDGKHIAFTSIRNEGRPEIYLLNLEDNSVQLLAGNESVNMQPRWSPDGKQIVFVTTRRGPYQIWVMDADGENPELLSRNENLKNSNPDWSQDGKVIVFTQRNNEEAGLPWLRAVPYVREGSVGANIHNPDLFPMAEAVFSPDGFWLAFESWPDGQNHDIYIMASNGISRLQVTNHPAWDFDAAWRPAVLEP